MNMYNPGWPATLTHDRVSLRPYRRSDATHWSAVRRRNEGWLAHWEPASGASWHEANSPAGFRTMYRDLRRSAKTGATWPFAVCYDGELVGGMTVGSITRRAFCSAHVGYWIDEQHAGKGIAPTALALICDHAFTSGRLHRIEVNIQPHNTPSRRVVEKLGFREEAMYKAYLYINNQWRDHIGFGMTVEDVTGGGVLARWLKSGKD
ncbi:ribosomal-protein-alanine N-acetyltransferase [Stackebrandtia endophytica]|uniref:Ribosomal-protein-alanine N-acetyltransferase n=1 Tax=Stackebrandtia endophytica TaxID=1496996 RepID=A0A543AYU3_9ACTN|nr:GNAT family protein [Stackebrandtia endophytica]TQL77745.1 ribosomal-protein-alanine N-acetyltransferase [Stackebrandtia endophytica]